MFPSKSMVEYMSEMNRLFSMPEDDILQGNQYCMPSQSPLYSTITNQSSSSTDSTSPESFPEISIFQQNFSTQPDLRADEPRTPIYGSPHPPRPPLDTPKASDGSNMVRRQRPIVGRKIFCSENASTPFERVQRPLRVQNEPQGLLWPDEVQFQQSPPSQNLMESKNYNQNVLYKFSPLDTNYEPKTPVKPPRAASNMSPMNSSPNQSLSPSSISHSPVGLLVPYKRPQTPNPSMWPSTSRSNYDIVPSKMCTFCRKNGETPIVYMTHRVKEKVGENRFIAACPILRSHVCSVCGATGDDAHTITYCPVLRNSNHGQPLTSTTITLKNTRIKSNGRRRF